MKKTVEEYEKEIEELNAKNECTVATLENQSKILLDKSIEFLKDRIKYEIESRVKNNSARTKELAEQGQLKDMKDSMNQLLEEVGQHTTAAMSGDEVFIHRTIKPDKTKRSYEYKGLVEKKYKDAYGVLIGLAGDILNKYGYIKVANDYNGHSEWKYISGSGGKIKYGYGFDMRAVEKDWEKYTGTLVEYYDNLLKQQSLLEEKEKTEAVDLWENI